ncbi:hypothetical protein [Streptomyces sp. NPDC049585]|uniref:hypothetical protein n=1 Tax=Streptomyces sp. NPDC049585 TaxID=3155154 RepID=UPI0034257E1E
MAKQRLRFDGWIAGAGTSTGTRIVLGHWPRTPFGAFSDVMVEHADGTRLLLAPTDRTAAFIASTYAFDRVRVEPVTVQRAGNDWSVISDSLTWHFTTGPLGLPGRLLRLVPPALAARPAWIRCADLPARMLGLRTCGSGRAGRREFYGIHDLRPIVMTTGQWEGTSLGGLSRVEPPVRFGFASVPRRPALIRVTTTVDLPAGGLAGPPAGKSPA